MSLLPDSASFEEKVQDCFTAYRGRGVELSALDVDLLVAWAQTGAPFEVVARGLRKAAENADWDAAENGGGLKSLRACRRQVDAEISKWATQSAGQHTAAADDEPEPFHRVRHKKLKATLRKIARTTPAVTNAATKLESKLVPPDDFEAAVRQEELAFAVLTRALPWNERRALLHQASRLVQNAQPISAHAVRESRRFHRAAALKRLLDLPSFW
jgi:hypothetical protein